MSGGIAATLITRVVADSVALVGAGASVGAASVAVGTGGGVDADDLPF